MNQMHDLAFFSAGLVPKLLRVVGSDPFKAADLQASVQSGPRNRTKYATSTASEQTWERFSLLLCHM